MVTTNRKLQTANYKGFTQHFKMLCSLLRDRSNHGVPHLSGGFNAPRQSAGFTLIEVMVSLFVFLIIMIAMSQTFTQSFAGYKNVKSVQRDVENAQFALNLMAKELRTSSIVSPSSGGSLVSAVKFYDYSQGLCLEYRVNASALQVAKAVALTFDDCVAASLGSYVTVTTGTVTGGFIITRSSPSPKSVGKVTIALEISEGPNHTAHIQTTSSLRDYGYIGL